MCVLMTSCHNWRHNCKVRPVLTCDASISINISIRNLCASEDSRNISMSFLLMLMLMLMFSEDIVDISIKCSLIG